MIEKSNASESNIDELEILEFTIDKSQYGINVSKVAEIIKYTPVTPVPNSDKIIKGIMMPRDTLITVVDLRRVLTKESSPETGFMIITNFNNLNIAFIVDRILEIRRIDPKQILKQTMKSSTEDEIVTGIYKNNNALISILDFEKIIKDISPNLNN